MKISKKGWMLIGTVFICFFLWSSLSLVKLHDRSASFSLSSQLKTEIADDTRGMTGEEIRKYSIRKTSQLLTFTADNAPHLGHANCMGYAQMYAAIANQGFRTNGLRDHAKPVVGYVKCCGINLCYVLKAIAPAKWKSFVSDHDFVEFTMDGRTIYADANAYDYILTDCKTEVK